MQDERLTCISCEDWYYVPMKPWDRGPDGIRENKAAILHRFNNWEATCREVDRLRCENERLQTPLPIRALQRVVDWALRQSRPRSVPR